MGTATATATGAPERGVEVVVRTDEDRGAVEAAAAVAVEESIPGRVEKTGVEVEVEKKDDNFYQKFFNSIYNNNLKHLLY